MIDPAPDYPHIANHSTVSLLATVDDDGSASDSGGGASDGASDGGASGDGRGEGEGGRGGGRGGAAPSRAAHRGLQLFFANFAPMAGATGAPWEHPRARNVSATLRVLPPCDRAPRKALLRRIDDGVTNPRAAWEAMGKPPSLSATQLEALHAASRVPSEAIAVVGAPAGEDDDGCTVTLGPIALPPYGVAHVGGFV